MAGTDPAGDPRSVGTRRKFRDEALSEEPAERSSVRRDRIVGRTESPTRPPPALPTHPFASGTIAFIYEHRRENLRWHGRPYPPDTTTPGLPVESIAGSASPSTLSVGSTLRTFASEPSFSEHPTRFGAFPPVRTSFHVLLPPAIVRFISAKPFRCRPNYRPAIRRSARPPGCSMAGGDTPAGRSGTVRVLSPVRPPGGGVRRPRRCFCSEWGEGCGTGSPMPRTGVRDGRSAGASRCGVFLVGSSPKRFRGSGKIAYFACVNPRTK